MVPFGVQSSVTASCCLDCSDSGYGVFTPLAPVPRAVPLHGEFLCISMDAMPCAPCDTASGTVVW
jgi:hypothetical protein